MAMSFSCLLHSGGQRHVKCFSWQPLDGASQIALCCCWDKEPVMFSVKLGLSRENNMGVSRESWPSLTPPLTPFSLRFSLILLPLSGVPFLPLYSTFKKCILPHLFVPGPSTPWHCHLAPLHAPVSILLCCSLTLGAAGASRSPTSIFSTVLKLLRNYLCETFLSPLSQSVVKKSLLHVSWVSPPAIFHN